MTGKKEILKDIINLAARGKHFVIIAVDLDAGQAHIGLNGITLEIAKVATDAAFKNYIAKFPPQTIGKSS